ncbi:hypothetical protein [Pseudoteredinibacter isoporae]|uniref:hypothetical protein n=1 Tax=Pseudoteredinibacter isoporae TaxID=570281 RepID=UPI003109D189
MMQSICLEIVKWKSNEGVSDADMIATVNGMVADLKGCEGFVHQSLYKNSENEWVDIYYWEDEFCAHDSNQYMADKDSLRLLLALIEPDSVSMEVLPLLQSSGELSVT